jgi:hypothetical protein
MRPLKQKNVLVPIAPKNGWRELKQQARIYEKRNLVVEQKCRA